jgi:hypothetical protein
MPRWWRDAVKFNQTDPLVLVLEREEEERGKV